MGFKKGINAWCFPKSMEIEKIFYQAKDYKFDGVELNLTEDADSPFHMGSSEEELLKIIELAEQYDLVLPTVATGLHWKYSLTSNEQKIREKGKAVISKMLEAAKIFGAKTILVVPGVVDSSVSYDIAYERSLTAIKELAEKAEELQVSIGVENVWNKFLLSPLEMRDFVDKTKSNYVGVYFDAGNILQFGYPEQWIKILGNRICAVHVKDFNCSVGNINGFVPLLAGDVQWERVVTALKEINYNGFITPEIPPYKFSPEQMIRHTSNSLETILKLEN
ncbi:sugar phosphate isomerase/epimerase [Bacillus sp. F19]|nr:sugar phosphate isomerase/epimerase [Bacillus sp. F19]